MKNMFKNVILVCIMPDLDHLKKSLVSQPNNRTFSNNYNRNATNKMCPPLTKIRAKKLHFAAAALYIVVNQSLYCSPNGFEADFAIFTIPGLQNQFIQF